MQFYTFFYPLPFITLFGNNAYVGVTSFFGRPLDENISLFFLLTFVTASSIVVLAKYLKYSHEPG